MNEVNYYQIGYGSYEDSDIVTLTHTEKFSEEDLEDMLVEYLNSKKNLPNKTDTGKNRLDRIMPENFIPFLCKKKGFKKLKYTSEFVRFGWPDIFDKNDWKGQREGLNSITDRLVRRKE